MMDRVLVRLVRPGDVEDLLALCTHAGYGLTSLVPETKRIETRIEASLVGEQPLLVMEERLGDEGKPGEVIGCAGVIRRVGCSASGEPFYAYRVERSIHQSSRLGVKHELGALHLVAEFEGPTLIGSLLLAPQARGKGLGRVMSLSRFVMMARERDRFGPAVIAELRGVIDEAGVSPFWESLGRHFFQVEYPTADRLSSKDKRFIGELMPKHPIYLPLLSDEAQAVIGAVHEQTQPAKRLLEREGFYATPWVDIFDAGPILRCDLQAIGTVRQTRSTVVAEVMDGGEADDAPLGSARFMVAPSKGAMRLVAGEVGLSDQGVWLTHSMAQRLEVELGDDVVVAGLDRQGNGAPG